jgi:hypothetical protein
VAIKTNALKTSAPEMNEDAKKVDKERSITHGGKSNPTNILRGTEMGKEVLDSEKGVELV